MSEHLIVTLKNGTTLRTGLSLIIDHTTSIPAIKIRERYLNQQTGQDVLKFHTVKMTEVNRIEIEL